MVLAKTQSPVLCQKKMDHKICPTQISKTVQESHFSQNQPMKFIDLESSPSWNRESRIRPSLSCTLSPAETPTARCGCWSRSTADPRDGSVADNRLLSPAMWSTWCACVFCRLSFLGTKRTNMKSPTKQSSLGSNNSDYQHRGHEILTICTPRMQAAQWGGGGCGCTTNR